MRVVRAVEQDRSARCGPAPAGPGELAVGEALADHLDVELPVRARAEERLDRGERHRRVLRLVRAVQRQEDLVVHAAEALQGEHLPADRDRPAQHAELAALAGDGRADLGAALQERPRGLLRPGRREITVAPVWMMPALASAMSSIVSPSHSVWSSPIGVITQTPAWSTLVASSAPPRPTSTTATSTGASANAANASAVVMSK